MKISVDKGLTGLDYVNSQGTDLTKIKVKVQEISSSLFPNDLNNQSLIKEILTIML